MNSPIGDKGQLIQRRSANRKAIEAASNAEREETLAAIREGLVDIKAGRIKPARAVLDRLATKYGIEAQR